LSELSTGAALRAAATLFNGARYLAAHEVLDDLWEATEGPEADFYKGLIQACIALHHFQKGNLEGAAKLYRGHRGLLAAYLPRHAGLDVEAFLEGMARALRPAVRREEGAVLDTTLVPALEFSAPDA